MKLFFIFSILIFGFNHFTFASSICGKTTGFSYNQDTQQRPYELSGFWLKQNTRDIRITYGNSPELISFIKDLKGSIFICLDKYELIEKTYAGKERTYAKVEHFRVWLNGKEITNSNETKEILFNLEKKRSVLDLKTDPNLKIWERDTYLFNLCFKHSTAKEAHAEILSFREQDLLFDFDTETLVDSWVEKDEVVINAINGKMMDDGLTESEATQEYIIQKCNF